MRTVTSHGGQALHKHGSLLASLLVSLPFAVSTVLLPFARDQGIYAYIASRLLQGDTLYRDIYVFKPPVTVYIHALSQWLFGHSMLSIRLLDVGWTLATIALLHTYVVRASGSRTWAFLASVCYAYCYHRQSWWTTAETDGWANLFLAAAFLCVTPHESRDESPRPLAHLIAGIALGLTFFLKYVIVLCAPWIVALPLLMRRRRGVTDAAMVVLGGLIACAAVVGHLAVTGGLEQFLATQRDVTLPYAGLDAPVQGIERIRLLVDRVASLGMPLLLGALFTIPMWIWLTVRAPDRRTEWRWFGASVAVWTASALASGWLQKKMFGYHFLPVLAPMSILAVGALARGVDALAAVSGKGGVRILACAVAVGLLALTRPFPTRWAVLDRVARTDDSLEQHWVERGPRTRDQSLATNVAVAAWLKQRTRPDERVFLWGFDPAIYFLAERAQVSRFPYTYPLVVGFAPERLRDELMHALETERPVVFGVASGDAKPLMHLKDSTLALAEFPRLSRFVHDHYVLSVRIGNWSLWTPRRPGPM